MNCRLLFTKWISLLSCLVLNTQADEPKKVLLEQLPTPVQKAIQLLLKDGKLDELLRVTQGEEVTYEGQLTVGGMEREFSVSADGTFFSIEITLDEAPPAVQKTIRTKVADGSIESIEKSSENGEILYEVEMTMKDGSNRSFSVAANGETESVELILAETPAAVRKSIEAQIGKAKLGTIRRCYDEDGVSYEVDKIADGETRSFVVTEDGHLESIQVFQRELSAAVLKTIKTMTGNGNLIRIDMVFGEDRSYCFDAEVKKNGKRTSFSVAPKGAFLGWNE